jgi:glyoxylase-like metal-dependent hydrolase (beta-lactamase superfamily II)
MIEQVLHDIYRIEIPLPNNPLKATNSYFIRGRQRNLLVDTGFNCEASRNAMDEALKDLDVQMETTDLFITHQHSDHAGLVNYLATPETTVWMSEQDGQMVAESRSGSHWSNVRHFVRLSGLAASGMEEGVGRHPGYKYASEVFHGFTMVKEGFEIKVGDYHFHTLETLGHTPGHMCLYDQEKKLLLSGDHILGKITPNITQWQLKEDVLGDYLKSLDKIATLEVDTVLPGHRYIVTDCRGRIDELKRHHSARLADVMTIIGTERMNAAQVASQMKWDLSIKEWEDFPWGQKLFATGEAMSHLYHLVLEGELILSIVDDIAYFNKN